MYMRCFFHLFLLGYNMNREKTLRFHLLYVPVFLLIFGSCDNTFDPTDQENGTYSVHGVLDLLEETSYIRVRDMNAPFTPDATETLDAIVTLHNLDSGERTQLNSQIREFEGVFLHTFIYNQGVTPDTPYLLSVESSSGIELELNTLTPAMPVMQVIRENDACTTPFELVFEPMNGGTLELQFGLDPYPREDGGRWSSSNWYVYGPTRYSDQVSVSINPLTMAQWIGGGFGNCSQLISRGHLFVAIAHYAPGFYERLNHEVTDILKTTRQFGGFYADTLAIPIDTSN